MSIDTQGNGAPAALSENKTESLVSASVGDRCVNCGSPLASDQRYCVVCGERRGAPRFSLPLNAPAAAESSSSPGPQRSRRPRVSSGSTLVAGVGTLLLAVGVGVLIGHDASGNTKTVAPGGTQVKVVTVGNGAAAAPAATSSGSGASTSSGSSAGSSSSAGGAKSSSKAGGKSTSKSKGSSSGAAKTSGSSAGVSAAAAQKASQAASKVLGGSSANQAPPTVTVGGAAPKGAAGVNKKTGKFDGSFFH